MNSRLLKDNIRKRGRLELVGLFYMMSTYKRESKSFVFESKNFSAESKNIGLKSTSFAHQSTLVTYI
jgi:hypothetical protein